MPVVVDYKTLVQDDRIHASLYTDPRVFADEMDGIFTRGWVFVGHASEIPRPGDWVTRTIGREPVVMVRGRDGAVTVLVNRCMHRGTMLCQGDRGVTARALTCPSTRPPTGCDAPRAWKPIAGSCSPARARRGRRSPSTSARPRR